MIALDCPICKDDMITGRHLVEILRFEDEYRGTYGVYACSSCGVLVAHPASFAAVENKREDDYAL